MSESILFEGAYHSKESHTLNRSPLDEAIAGLEGAATRFSIDAIKDAVTRDSYTSNVRRISIQVREEALSGKISSLEAVEFCNEMRNKILAEHRKITSPQGLAVAVKYKKEGPTLPTLFEKYAKKNFGSNYADLSPEQKKIVHYNIIDSSSRDSAKFTNGSKRLKIMGKVGILVTATLATYEIANADNKPKEAARQGIILSGGAVGGFLAGLGVSAICGPGAPVCAIAVVLAGSIAGGVAGSITADALDEELEEFSKWMIF